MPDELPTLSSTGQYTRRRSYHVGQCAEDQRDSGNRSCHQPAVLGSGILDITAVHVTHEDVHPARDSRVNHTGLQTAEDDPRVWPKGLLK